MKKLLALVTAVVAGSVLAAEGARTSFRFASWNIGHFSLGNQPSSSVRPEEAEARSADYRRFLGEVGADVIGVCEYSADFCTDGTVRTERAVFGDYGPRTVGTNALWRWDAVFSKGFPVTDGASVPFTADYPGLHKWLKGTAYTTSVLEIAGVRVVFAQVHLAWEELRLRRAQMDQLISDLADEPHVVIAGDFNVGIDATEGFEAYLKDRTKVSRRAKSGEFELFRKAGYALGNDESFPTAPAGDRKYPLDNIIVRGLTIRDFRVFDRPDLSDHALVSAVLELDGPCAAAQPGVMMRFASVQTRSLAEWKETAKAFAGNPGCCDDIWFSTGESFPSVAWHRRYLDVLREAAKDVRKAGVRVSLQFEATIGHGDDFPTEEEKKIFDKPWTGWTGPDGTECRYCNCPRQPAFLRRLADVSELYAEIRPAVVWIDDDMRITHHPPVSGRDAPGCWCATCVADFAAEEGREWTRETLRTAYGTDKDLQTRWHDFSSRSMARAARTIARAFRKVSPRTRMGLQTAADRIRMAEIVVRALAAETGAKVGVRIGGGDYYDFSPLDQIVKSAAAAETRRAMDLEDVVDNWCTEVESYPRAYGSRSVRSIALESFSSLGWGFDTTSLFVMDRRSETDETYARYLLAPMVSVTGFLTAYRAANRGTVPAGFTGFGAGDRRRLTGLPLLPGRGRSWGAISAERMSYGGLGAVWGEFRSDRVPDAEKTPSAKLQAVRDRLSGSAPLEVLSPFVGFVLPRVTEKGGLRTVGLIGARLDVQRDIVLRVDTENATVSWVELDAPVRTLKVETVGAHRQVTVPSLGAWNCGFLVF